MCCFICFHLKVDFSVKWGHFEFERREYKKQRRELYCACLAVFASVCHNREQSYYLQVYERNFQNQPAYTSLQDNMGPSYCFELPLIPWYRGQIDIETTVNETAYANCIGLSSKRTKSPHVGYPVYEGIPKED